MKENIYTPSSEQTNKKLFAESKQDDDSVAIGKFVIKARPLMTYDSSKGQDRPVSSGQCELLLFLASDISKPLSNIRVILDCLPSKAKHKKLVNILNFSVDLRNSRSKDDIGKIESILFEGMIQLYKGNDRRLSTVTGDFEMDRVVGVQAIDYFASRFGLQTDTATGLGAAVVTPW